ncbi:MAG: hypothetical protein GY759_17940 [Chloroflexi bacterium]|nr:hypothetical protein [Chloroflexota bacterium]
MTLLVVDVLENIGVPYFIGGSMATAVHGVSRTTMDVDIVADIRLDHATALVRALEHVFYVDIGMIREAIRH